MDNKEDFVWSEAIIHAADEQATTLHDLMLQVALSNACKDATVVPDDKGRIRVQARHLPGLETFAHYLVNDFNKERLRQWSR